MDKVLVILPDNNKGKYIIEGYAAAFHQLKFFVIEKKSYDLNIQEIKGINPQVILCYWADTAQNNIIKDTISNLEELKTSNFIHIAELKKYIPTEFTEKQNHFCFTSDSKEEKFKLLQCIDAKPYKTTFEGYKYNITFSGNPAYKNREEILCKLIYNFGPINIFCRSYDFYKSLDEINKDKILNEYYLELYRASYQGYLENQTDIAKIYCSSKINIDINNPNKNTINYRCLEIAASGGFLITQNNEAVTKQFEDGKELETYNNAEELIDKVNFYLNNLNIAQQIAYNGRKNAVSNHRFYDKLKNMLKVVYDKDFSN